MSGGFASGGSGDGSIGGMGGDDGASGRNDMKRWIKRGVEDNEMTIESAKKLRRRVVASANKKDPALIESYEELAADATLTTPKKGAALRDDMQ